ncbi:MAG TPA: pitrilysin family protein [Kofleriaceae bacterium]|nr:pitrilysin family protein [Kofleriaceae bacterium]
MADPSPSSSTSSPRRARLTSSLQLGAAALVAATLAAASAPGSSAAAPAAMTIDHYTLDNGLEVILQPDPTVTSAVVQVWYHVGSKDEVIGKTGFAHLFEHLMFEGSKHVPEGQFDQLLEAAGGWNNGTTNNDRTTFFEQVPAAQLPLALWLEADRMAGLWDAMNLDVFTNQRDVVENERRQSYENRPYGMADLEVQQALWPKGHGNWNLTIGTMEDLDAANLADVEHFWRTYYLPSNATLVVVGGFDPAKVKAEIQQLFAWMPKRPKPALRTLDAPVVPLDKPVRLTSTDNVQAPKVILDLRAPQAYGPGFTDVEIATQILGGSKTSRLSKRLVFQDQLVTEVYAALSPQMLGSELSIEAVAKPGVDIAKVEAAILDEIAKLQAAPPTAAEVERARRVTEVGLLSSLENVASRAQQLAEWAAYTGDPDHLAEDEAALAAVTPDTVWAAAKTWIRPDAAVTMIVNPQPAGGK